VFDNHRIVHGRSAYSATSGDRYLRGTYSDRGEMRSTYRAMVSEGRFK
jgi:gamma-butyrobetaine dioxygenase